MLIFAGLLLVFASIAAGFLFEHGQWPVLVQPAELLIIGGAAAGIILVSNPSRNLRRLVRALRDGLRPASYSESFYISALKLLYVLFAFARRAGLSALENHIDDPENSSIFAAYPELNDDSIAITFLCDSFRAATSAGLDADELDRLMSADLQVQCAGRQQPVSALLTVADSLPGLGIVAAVLGVVITMQALGGPAGEVGQRVAAALVGTFLGILLCYGVVGPLGARLQCVNRSRTEFLQVLRTGVLAFARGASPIIAAEFARRSIPIDVRPSYDDMEQELRRNTKIPEGQRPAVGAQAR